MRVLWDEGRDFISRMVGYTHPNPEKQQTTTIKCTCSINHSFRGGPQRVLYKNRPSVTVCDVFLWEKPPHRKKGLTRLRVGPLMGRHFLGCPTIFPFPGRLSAIFSYFSLPVPLPFLLPFHTPWSSHFYQTGEPLFPGNSLHLLECSYWGKAQKPENSHETNLCGSPSTFGKLFDVFNSTFRPLLFFFGAFHWLSVANWRTRSPPVRDCHHEGDMRSIGTRDDIDWENCGPHKRLLFVTSNLFCVHTERRGIMYNKRWFLYKYISCADIPFCWVCRLHLCRYNRTHMYILLGLHACVHFMKCALFFVSGQFKFFIAFYKQQFSWNSFHIRVSQVFALR